MSLIKRLLLLQLFADGDGGDGGEGASAETSGVADRSYESRLRELGVPENKIRKRAKGSDSVLPTEPTQTATENVEKEDTPTDAEAPQTAAKRLSWEEIMADPEYNQRMQETMQNRVRKSKEAEDKLSKLAPALDALARKHSLDVDNLDIDELVKAVVDDDSNYEEYALQMGVPVETARKLDQAEKENARRQREEAESLERRQIVQHINNLEAQANELKKTFPNFDLKAELQNPTFARMTSPAVNMPVEAAYYAVHHKEIQQASMQITAQKTAQAIANNLQSGKNRPVEAGSGTQAASITTFNYANASKQQREALKARIRRGEKIYPGRE